MPVPKIVAKAIVGSIKGKKAGEAAATAAAKKAAAAKAAAANARGLKAAQGPSMAPKGLQKIMLQSAPVNVVSKSGKKVIKPKAK